MDAWMVLCMEWCIWMREDSAGVRFAVWRGVCLFVYMYAFDACVTIWFALTSLTPSLCTDTIMCSVYIGIWASWFEYHRLAQVW